MDFEWDARKAASNLAKHGVDFADAVSAFDDIQALTLPNGNGDEERLVTIATDLFGRVIVVVYTCRGKCIRLISARKATRQERVQYEGRP